MFVNLVDQFKSRILAPAIDARMRAMGEAGVAEARRLVPVDSGNLQRSIGYSYDAKEKIITLYADQHYAYFVELGTRVSAARPYLRPAIAVMAKAWGGLARIGINVGAPSIAVSAPNVAPKYHDRIRTYTKGKIGRASLHVGHGRHR